LLIRLDSFVRKLGFVEFSWQAFSEM